MLKKASKLQSSQYFLQNEHLELKIWKSKIFWNFFHNLLVTAIKPKSKNPKAAFISSWCWTFSFRNPSD
jgi:hypothetical protein